MSDADLKLDPVRIKDLNFGHYGKIVEVSVRGRLVAFGQQWRDGQKQAHVKAVIIDDDGMQSELTAVQGDV